MPTSSSDTGSLIVFFPKSFIFSLSYRSESTFSRSVSYRAWSFSSVSLHSSPLLEPESSFSPRIIDRKKGSHIEAEQMVGTDLAEEFRSGRRHFHDSQG